MKRKIGEVEVSDLGISRLPKRKRGRPKKYIDEPPVVVKKTINKDVAQKIKSIASKPLAFYMI